MVGLLPPTSGVGVAEEVVRQILTPHNVPWLKLPFPDEPEVGPEWVLDPSKEGVSGLSKTHEVLHVLPGLSPSGAQGDPPGLVVLQLEQDVSTPMGDEGVFDFVQRVGQRLREEEDRHRVPLVEHFLCDLSRVKIGEGPGVVPHLFGTLFFQFERLEVLIERTDIVQDEEQEAHRLVRVHRSTLVLHYRLRFLRQEYGR